MFDKDVLQASNDRQFPRRVLFVSACATDETVDLQHGLLNGGYQIERSGIGEALWLWPLLGYDLVLIDATDEPQTGAELCHHIKSTYPAQRVALLVGDRTGMVSNRFEADAVWSGAPTAEQLLGAVHLLLPPNSICTAGEVPKRPVQTSVLREYGKETSA